MRDTDYVSAHANVKENNVEQTQTKYDFKKFCWKFQHLKKTIYENLLLKKKILIKYFFPKQLNIDYEYENYNTLKNYTRW